MWTEESALRDKEEPVSSPQRVDCVDRQERLMDLSLLPSLAGRWCSARLQVRRDAAALASLVDTSYAPSLSFLGAKTPPLLRLPLHSPPTHYPPLRTPPHSRASCPSRYSPPAHPPLLPLPYSPSIRPHPALRHLALLSRASDDYSTCISRRTAYFPHASCSYFRPLRLCLCL